MQRRGGNAKAGKVRRRPKTNAGSIEVETRPGEFTEVRVILPRSALFV